MEATISNKVEDNTTTTTTTTTNAAAATVPCPENNSHRSNGQRQLAVFEKCSLPCQLRGLVTRGLLIDKSRGSLITFCIGIVLIVICWGLLAVSSYYADNLSKWWDEETPYVGQVCLPYSIFRYRNYYSIRKPQWDGGALNNKVVESCESDRVCCVCIRVDRLGIKALDVW